MWTQVLTVPLKLSSECRVTGPSTLSLICQNYGITGKVLLKSCVMELPRKNAERREKSSHHDEEERQEWKAVSCLDPGEDFQQGNRVPPGSGSWRYRVGWRGVACAAGSDSKLGMALFLHTNAFEITHHLCINKLSYDRVASTEYCTCHRIKLYMIHVFYGLDSKVSLAKAKR